MTIFFLVSSWMKYLIPWYVNLTKDCVLRAISWPRYMEYTIESFWIIFPSAYKESPKFLPPKSRIKV